MGGVESVIVGDAMARSDAAQRGDGAAASKLRAQRGGEPTFDAVVEVRRGELHAWRVVLDVAAAVDAVLQGRQYEAQERRRDPATGAVTVAPCLA